MTSAGIAALPSAVQVAGLVVLCAEAGALVGQRGAACMAAVYSLSGAIPAAASWARLCSSHQEPDPTPGSLLAGPLASSSYRERQKLSGNSKQFV